MYKRNKAESPSWERSGLVCVPSGVIHGIQNISEAVLTYFSWRRPPWTRRPPTIPGSSSPKGEHGAWDGSRSEYGI
jgi:hypothetical protein